MTDAGIQVSVSVELAAMTRANIIGHVAGDLAGVLPAIKAETIKSIIIGFREAILSSVEFIIADEPGDIVGYMAIEVDWRRYSIAIIEESNRSVLKLDPQQPVTDQVAPLLARARSYIQQACKEVKAAKCHPIYTYRSVRTEEAQAKIKAFKKKYHLTAINDKTRKRLEEVRLNKKLVVSDSSLPEMTVTFKRKQNPPA
ncbi:hypothetical protein [Nonomuraea wenchangensis]|uniref:hypothetical protein n=1 Tax=Nonomuraea wenchangensis TaxID=568860 RepID=UPI0034330903